MKMSPPPNWANYGEIFADFQMTSGVRINSLDPNAGSADELAAILLVQEPRQCARERRPDRGQRRSGRRACERRWG